MAYSGGVDSAYLAWAATRALGAGRALCVTADSPSYPERHRTMALAIARDFGLRHEIIQTDELARPEYRANPTNRCYFCKHELYTALDGPGRARAGSPRVADGSNADDRGDYRPGRQAAREFGVVSPLDDAELSKDDIRALSHEAGLPTWDEPASACLSSRIPYFSEVTRRKAARIEQAEEAVRALGFRVLRVRHHGEVARLELGRDEMARALDPDVAAAIDRALRGARLPLRDARPARLPARQPQRGRRLCTRSVIEQPDVQHSATARRLPRITMTRRLRLIVALAGLVFLAAHVRALPRTLEDLDSINFALGVEHFDVGRHQPHPPGYPVYIALARSPRAVLRVAAPSWDRDRVAAGGLAVWGVLAGTLAAFVFAEFWIAVGLTPVRRAACGRCWPLASPLFWFTRGAPVERPPGLVAARRRSDRCSSAASG